MDYQSKKPFIAVFFVILTALAFSLIEVSSPDRMLSSTGNTPDDYTHKAKPIFDQYCVACHSCYNSPCQLDLSSYEGFARGLHKTLPVYNNKRLEAQTPSRLFTDATAAGDWRSDDVDEAYKFTSVIETIMPVSLTTSNKGNGLKPEESRFCTNSEAKVPPIAMPYRLHPIENEEDKNTLLEWLAQGAPGPEVKAQPSVSASKHISWWQKYLNGKGQKRKLIARYLYEHLFLAHIHFEDKPEFFKLIRSKTSCDNPVDVGTVRPYDDPGANFQYCFRKIHSTLVHKTHITYKLDRAKRNRVKDLFDNTEWSVGKLPSYNIETASNPFVTFSAIPAKSRWQFLLDDARYFVMTFIRGPVCKGNTAVNVINEQFHVMFVDPDAYDGSTHPDGKDLHAFVEENKHLLNLPAGQGSNIDDFTPIPGKTGGKVEEVKGIARVLLGIKGVLAVPKIKRKLNGKGKPEGGLILDRIKYRENKYRFYKETFGDAGYDITKHIWDGDGKNQNALLTIMRHHDSASVSFGALGPTPKTMWVIDYVSLESIYYNLVAGFDVFGDAGHQTTTRYYKSIQRLDGEEHFLYLLKPEQRQKMRSSWYIKGPNHERPTEKIVNLWYPIEKIGGISSSTEKSKPNWTDLEKIRQEKFKEIYDSQFKDLFDGSRNAEEFAAINGKRAQFAPYVQFFPDHAFVRDGGNVYTLIRNKQHYNVSWVKDEKLRRDHANDLLFAVQGLVGSYPMMFFDTKGSVSNFVREIQLIKDEDDFKAFKKKFGIGRMSKKFWPTYRFMNEKMVEQNDIEAGLFDLNRYGIPTPK